MGSQQVQKVQGSSPSPGLLYEKTRPLEERITEILSEPTETMEEEIDALSRAQSLLNDALR